MMTMMIIIIINFKQCMYHYVVPCCQLCLELSSCLPHTLLSFPCTAGSFSCPSCICFALGGILGSATVLLSCCEIIAFGLQLQNEFWLYCARALTGVAMTLVSLWLVNLILTSCEYSIEFTVTWSLCISGCVESQCVQWQGNFIIYVSVLPMYSDYCSADSRYNKCIGCYPLRILLAI